VKVIGEKSISGTSSSSVVDPDPHPHPDPDLHHFGNLEPHPDPHQRDKLDPEADPDPHQFADDKPKSWDVSLFEHFFKSLSLYFEARICRLLYLKLGSTAYFLQEKETFSSYMHDSAHSTFLSFSLC
jgi:hypothetical protein